MTRQDFRSNVEKVLTGKPTDLELDSDPDAHRRVRDLVERVRDDEVRGLLDTLIGTVARVRGDAFWDRSPPLTDVFKEIAKDGDCGSKVAWRGPSSVSVASAARVCDRFSSELRSLESQENRLSVARRFRAWRPAPYSPSGLKAPEARAFATTPLPGGLMLATRT